MSTCLAFSPDDGPDRPAIRDRVDSITHAGVVGASTEWKDVLKKATQVAATDTTVLLTGESGTTTLSDSQRRIPLKTDGEF